MPLHIDPDSPLPRFRIDLRLYKGPLDSDGAPTFNLFDPLNGRYYKITWEQSLILQNLRPGVTLNELCKELNLQSTAKTQPEDVKIFLEDAFNYNLLEVQKSSEQLIKEVQRSKISYFKSLFYRYLYFRVPLIKPNEFLKKTLPYVLPLVSPIALTFYLILSTIGIILLISRFTEYLNTFTYFFNLYGLLSYLIGIVFFKLIHEFAHAYTAAYYKINIPTMGIAFIFLTPVLYTDATDGWKLSNRGERLRVSAAGLIAELILAGLCTLGWALSPPGALQSVFFVISSVIWFSSLLLNMNPAMRYDGYYILSDFLGIDNLQSRSFTLTRWWMHNAIFGMNLPCPEEAPSKKMRALMIVFAIYTWIYRLLLYTGIALFFYLVNVKFKVFGILLFILVVNLFIIFPIISEIRELIRLRTSIRRTRNLIIFVSLLSILTLWVALPLPHKITFSAIAVAVQTQNIYVPEPAQIKSIHVKQGDTVNKGQLLLELSSRPLDVKIADFRLREHILQEEFNRLELNIKKLPFIQEKLEELESVKSQVAGLEKLRNQLQIVSTIDGKLIFLDDELTKGQYVYEGTLMGKIVQPEFKVIAYIPEDSMSDLSLNQKVEFISHRNYAVYEGSISSMSPTRTKYLEYPTLASINRGDLPVVKESDSTRLKLLESMYSIEITLNNPHPKPALHYEETGVIKTRGPWRSYVESFWSYLLRIFWRESGV